MGNKVEVYQKDWEGCFDPVWGTVVATATLAEIIKLNPELALANAKRMGLESMTKKESVELWGSYAWVLKDVVRFKCPVPYKHH